MIQSKSYKIILRSLAWFVMLTQVTSSASFADIKVFSKETLAPKIVSDPTPPADSDNNDIRQDMVRGAVFKSMGRLFFDEHKNVAELRILLRDAYRNYSPQPGGVLLDTIKPSDKSITVEYNDPNVQGVCIALLYPKDHGSSQSFGIDKRVKGHFKDKQNALSFSDTEPLIGHKFSAAELENIKITPWGQSEAFSKTLDELEDKIKARAPDTIKDRMIRAIAGFRNSSEGRKLGVVKSVYESVEKYYLGFGIKNTIGLAAEFFDPRNPLYEYRFEAIFHELFHAEFGRNDEYSASHDTSTHLLAMQIAAVIFWKEMADDKVKGLTLEALESHPKNKFGEQIRSWKGYQQLKLEDVDVPKAMAQKDWKYLLNELRESLKVGWESNRSVPEFLIACDEAAALNKRHPVEARYPIIKAVTYLSKKEKEALITVLMGTECAAIRSLPVVDSILLMLKKEVPADWLSRQAPKLKERSTWIVSSEVWNAGGGLGRVEQSHSIGDALLLKQEGPNLKTCEPYYTKTIDKKTGSVIDTDYPVLLGINFKEIKEVDRFEVPVGDSIAFAVCYMAINKFGIESYLIKGFKKGQAETEAPYYTERLYHYRNEKEPNLVSLAEFAAFFSKSSLELTRRVEENRRADMKDKYRPPVMHFNDGQLGLAPLFRSIYYKDDPILGLGKAMIGYSTHTYPNRVWVDRKTGEDMLRYLDIPQAAWKYFYRHYETIIDMTSAGARTADWYAGVSAKHVDDILSYKYDNWGEWEYLNDTMVSVTNGDIRSATAHVFREIMLELFPDADVEEPTWGQVLATKREAKKRLGLREDQPVVSFSGRVVKEKASRKRAFCDENIRKMVMAGIQVVIGANVAANPDMIDHIESFAKLEKEIARDKLANPELYKGSFTLMRNIDIEVQRAILAATDIQIQDSDPNTEAAGYSEADVAVCGGLELAPSWTEGILQSQGIPINLDIPGEGNTIIPKDGNPDSYFEAVMSVLEKFPEELAKYQANAVRLSSILEALLTSAEYLRQWNRTVEKMEAAAALKDQAGRIAPELVGKGSVRNGLETIYNSELKFKSDISTRRDLLPKRMKTQDTAYSLSTVQEEVKILKALGILADGTSPGTFQLRSQIRNLSPPEFKKILSIPELDLATIPQDKIPALRRQVEKLVSDIYKARPKYVTITSSIDFSREAAAKVANEIRFLQNDRPDKDVVMVFATGNTMVGFLDELSKAERIDWDRVQAFHLDEMKGLDIEHSSSYAYFLNKNLFSKVSIPRVNIHYISEYIKRFNGDLKKAFDQYREYMGAQDITIVGIGPDGHLAGNEPPLYSSFDSTMQEVPLNKSTIDANKDRYSELETDPETRFWDTIGMADIFRSRAIFLLANKSSKADIIAKAIDGSISEDIPASMLQMHRNVNWIMDEDAAAITSGKDRYADARAASNIESDMAVIHNMNLNLIPSVENGKVLYHVIAEELIPITMRAPMANLARYTENMEMRERIKIVERKDMLDALDGLSDKPQNIILAAVQYKEDLVLLPKGVKALVFTGDTGGAYGFRQIEGIIAALRALERSDAAALARLYGLLTGTPFIGKESDILKYIQDPQALAGFIIFNLEPSTAKDATELKRLNDSLLEFLYKA